MTSERDTDLQRLRRQRVALADFGLFAFQSRDLDAVLHNACERLSDCVDVRLVKVLERLPAESGLLIRAGVGWRPGVVGAAVFGPGDGSPAGYALQTQGAVISRRLEDETRFAIPPLLVEHGVRSMVNVVIPGQDGAPYGVLEVDAPQPRDFDEDDIAFLRNFANLLAAAIERARAHEALEAKAKEQSLLVRELAHRVKNLLGLVQALATRARAEHPAAQAFRDLFVGRLQALARAENLVFEDSGQEIELATLVRTALEPIQATHPAALSVEAGPPMNLPARKGRILGLVLHELFTNAMKHGALSREGGAVRLGWRVEAGAEAPMVELFWIERGGPPADPPGESGFGAQLITRLAAYELGGRAEPVYGADGFRYRLVFPGNGS